MRHLLVLITLAASLATAQIENNLRPRIQVKGDPEIRWTIAERQAFHKTPAVSIAVMKGGEIVLAKAWGATPDLLFQAASISKPVASATALRLVADGKLSLDEDVNVKLKSWKVPANSFGKPITLRMLLSHTAGLTVHGFPGYAADAAVPTLVQLLDGTKPANTAAIKVDIEPGKTYRYSGGGYEVMQLLVEDVTGKPFAQVAKALVLDPAGMKSSTYEQPLPETLRAKAAVAHKADGTPIAGKWHTYPEQAAAGLWTTPSDLARFLLAVRSNKLLPATMTNEMLTPVLSGYGLGFGIDGQQYSHGGSNEGYRCNAVAFRDTGDGAVVMTNSDRGATLGGEVLRAIAEEYKWPAHRVVIRDAIKLTAEELAPYLGTYDAGRQSFVVTAREGGGLRLATPGGPAEFLPESATRFFPLSDGAPTINFAREADGTVTGFSAGNLKATKRK